MTTTIEKALSVDELEQTPAVELARAAVERWRAIEIGAFLGSSSDEDMQAAWQMIPDVKNTAIELSALTASSEDDRDALRGLAALMAHGGDSGSDLLESYVYSVFSLGLLYGLRLRSLTGGAR